jgi:hypothetical protein
VGSALNDKASAATAATVRAHLNASYAFEGDDCMVLNRTPLLVIPAALHPRSQAHSAAVHISASYAAMQIPDAALVFAVTGGLTGWRIGQGLAVKRQ